MRQWFMQKWVIGGAAALILVVGSATGLLITSQHRHSQNAHVVTSPTATGTYQEQPVNIGGGSPSPHASVTPISTSDPGSTPAPNPTSAPPPPTGSACTSTSEDGSCGPYAFSNVSPNNPGAPVLQDVWNPASAYISQKLTAYSATDWNVVANMSAGNTAVLSYPDTQQVMTTASDTSPAISSFSRMSSSYSETLPSSGDFESAYDIWLSTSAGNWNQEIMIWTDNHGQTPAGSQTGQTATIGSQTYTVWNANDNPVTLEATSNATSGTVDILGAMKWLQSHGYVSATAGFSGIDYGFELCSTGGGPETFSLNGYSLG